MYVPSLTQFNFKAEESPKIDDSIKMPQGYYSALSSSRAHNAAARDLAARAGVGTHRKQSGPATPPGINNTIPILILAIHGVSFASLISHLDSPKSVDSNISVTAPTDSPSNSSVLSSTAPSHPPLTHSSAPSSAQLNALKDLSRPFYLQRGALLRRDRSIDIAGVASENAASAAAAIAAASKYDLLSPSLFSSLHLSS